MHKKTPQLFSFPLFFATTALFCSPRLLLYHNNHDDTHTHTNTAHIFKQRARARNGLACNTVFFGSGSSLSTLFEKSRDALPLSTAPCARARTVGMCAQHNTTHTRAFLFCLAPVFFVPAGVARGAAAAAATCHSTPATRALMRALTCSLSLSLTRARSHVLRRQSLHRGSTERPCPPPPPPPPPCCPASSRD